MKILFSPIGTADPITQLGDGPMLHIVRHRRPQKVVLFLSPAMAGHQDADARYTKAVQMLAEEEGWQVPQIELVRSDYADVFRFDHYIEEFEPILARLEHESEGEPVLANASSGTPAMEQALVAVGSFGRLNVELLQVTTPRKNVNARHDREDPNNYDFDELWAWNASLREQEPDNRIVEVGSPNFADRLLRENVVALVKRYDYEAAYALAGQMLRVDAAAVEMIKAAADRLNLLGSLPAKVFGGTDLAYRSNDLLSEYLSVMEVRLLQGHWAEFLRSMTPAFTAVVKRRLGHYLPESKYLYVINGKATNELNYTAIYEDDTLHSILAGDGQSRYLKNALLVKLFERYCDDESMREKVRRLREMEDKSRNNLAHEVQSSAKGKLEKEGGLSFETVLDYLFELHGSVKPGLYDCINQAIFARLQG